MNRLRHSAIFLVLTLLWGCSGGGQTTRSGSGYFSDQILPLLQTKFAPLLSEESGLNLESWEGLIAGSDDGEVLIPFDSERSLLVRLATKKVPSHPAAAAITAEELARVRDWIDSGAKNDAGQVPYADASNVLFACNQDAALVSIIDMDANVVIRTVDLQKLGFSATAKPHHALAEADGSFWYLSLIGESKVLKFDRQNRIVAQLEFETPGMMAMHPEKDLLFVGRSMSAVNPPQRIGFIGRTSMDGEEVDVFFPKPHALAIAPDGQHVYSASLAENRVISVDTDTEEPDLLTLPGDIHTMVQFAVSPDGSTLVTGGQVTGQFLFFDLEDPVKPKLDKSIKVNAAPWHPIFSPDGAYVYFGNKSANTVTVVDMGRREVDAVIEGTGLAEPHGVALTPDGKRLYVSSNNTRGEYKPRYDFGDNALAGTVVVIDTTTRQIIKVLEVDKNTTGLGTRLYR